jgi:hypothetical protein
MRNKLSEHHKKFFQGKGINFIAIGGDWKIGLSNLAKLLKKLSPRFHNLLYELLQIHQLPET